MFDLQIWPSRVDTLKHRATVQSQMLMELVANAIINSMNLHNSEKAFRAIQLFYRTLRLPTQIYLIKLSGYQINNAIWALPVMQCINMIAKSAPNFPTNFRTI